MRRTSRGWPTGCINIAIVADAFPTIALVGLPGAGKSTIGRLVAAQLSCSFFDLDAEIERHAGLSVSEIFENHGERHFRALERDVTAVLASRGGILATGGGWMSNPGAMALVRPTGHIIYLRVGADCAISRMGRSMASRPLLADPDPSAKLARLLVDREDDYQLADAVVDTEDVGIEKVTEQVALLATRFWAW